MSLESLLQRADVWCGRAHSLRENATHSRRRTIASGLEALDAQLPGGGWPLGALTEILLQHHGIGELRLLMPALARMSREGRWLAWVAPPYLPYAPALAQMGVDLSRLMLIRPRDPGDTLWTMEQALRSRACGAVLAWPRRVDSRRLRRLQLATEAGRAMGVLFRPWQESRQPSPAALRLQLTASPEGTRIWILKCRGNFKPQAIVFKRNHAMA